MTERMNLQMLRWPAIQNSGHIYHAHRRANSITVKPNIHQEIADYYPDPDPDPVIFCFWLLLAIVIAA